MLADLADEQRSLDELVASLDYADWDRMTPAEPWTIRDQISHLAFFDQQAALAAADGDAFIAEINRAFADGADAYMRRHLDHGRSLTPDRLLAWWRDARLELANAFGSVAPDQRIPWYGPPMRARSSAVARMMETWAHGLDVADALDVVRPPTVRLFHIAELGVKTFRFSFENRGLTVPEDRVAVELSGPDGSTRVWNTDATDRITGDVEEFCQVVAQRRHVDDTELRVFGTVARAWMENAQIFAGPPGPGRSPGGG